MHSEPGHAGHAQVEHDAVGRRVVRRREEQLARRERAHAVTGGPKDVAHGIENATIIVHQPHAMRKRGVLG